MYGVGMELVYTEPLLYRLDPILGLHQTMYHFTGFFWGRRLDGTARSAVYPVERDGFPLYPCITSHPEKDNVGGQPPKQELSGGLIAPDSCREIPTAPRI